MSDILAALLTVMDQEHADGRAYIEENSIPEPNSGCWLWLGRVNPKGYGTISKYRWGVAFAHRLALWSDGRLIPEMMALHKCDQPGCVNPAHLYAGTAQQNADDRANRNRFVGPRTPLRGEKNPLAKLTDESVADIRANYAKGDPQHSLPHFAKKYGVSANLIHLVVHNRIWRHVQ